MWPWQVKLWTYQGNMYVNYSNTVSNTLRNTKAYMQNCYGQETWWTSGEPLTRAYFFFSVHALRRLRPRTKGDKLKIGAVSMYQ